MQPSERDDDSHPPRGLSRLRRRCTIAAAAAGACYIALVTATVVRPHALHGVVALGLELGFLAVAGMLGLIAVMVWILTEHVDYALTVYSTVSKAHAVTVNQKAEILNLGRSARGLTLVSRGDRTGRTG